MQEGTGWGGATLPGSPPTLATTPFGSQAMPSQPLGAPGLFHRAGRGEGGKEEPLVRAEPEVGLGAGGLRLARPLPGTQGLDLPWSLAWVWG